MLASQRIDLLVVALDSSDELLQRTRLCHDGGSTGSNDCHIRRRRCRLSDLIQTVGDMFGIAAVVIDEEVFNRPAWPAVVCPDSPIAPGIQRRYSSRSRQTSPAPRGSTQGGSGRPASVAFWPECPKSQGFWGQSPQRSPLQIYLLNIRLLRHRFSIAAWVRTRKVHVASAVPHHCLPLPDVE